VDLTVTVTDTTQASDLTVWPAGLPQPVASNLNFVGGETVANNVVVAVPRPVRRRARSGSTTSRDGRRGGGSVRVLGVPSEADRQELLHPDGALPELRHPADRSFGAD